MFIYHAYVDFAGCDGVESAVRRDILNKLRRLAVQKCDLGSASVAEACLRCAEVMLVIILVLAVTVTF